MIKSGPVQPLIASLLFALSVAFTAAGQQSSTTFTGKLDPKLTPDMVHVYKRVWTAADTSKLKFSSPPEKASVVSIGELIDTRKESGKSAILLVEPASGPPYIWFDADENGIFETDEKSIFKMPVDMPNDLIVYLQLPIKTPYYSSFPIYIHYFRVFTNPKLKPTDRLVEQSVNAVAKGRVDIHSKNVLFQYPFEPRISAISNTEGLFGVDVNGDGKIRDEQFSPESSYAANVEIVFPLGDGYISTQSVDLATGKIVVRKRDKSEYHRVDLNVGDMMPDFTFTDLEGKERHLSDFRGKYLMVDFWGVWCSDCQRETPFHLEAYKRFKGRGFEILGLDSDQKIEIMKAYITKNGISWPQATNDSIKQLATVTYRIQEYPSTILLGPDGKVLVLDQRKLKGEELLKTLDQTLPK